MPATLIYKLIGGLIAALALFLLVQDRNRWKRVAGERNAEVITILGVTREAAGNPGLERANIPRQIRLLGESLAATTGALNRQNGKVKQLGEETARAKQEAATAHSRAQERAQGAAATRGRLEASALAPERQSAPCELSPTLKDAWK